MGLTTLEMNLQVQYLNMALWGLDRIDQRDLPLDSMYLYGKGGGRGRGNGTTIYVVDSGLMATHQARRLIFLMKEKEKKFCIAC